MPGDPHGAGIFRLVSETHAFGKQGTGGDFFYCPLHSFA